MFPTAEVQKALITGSSGKSLSDHFLTLNFSGSRSCCTLSLEKKKKKKYRIIWMLPLILEKPSLFSIYQSTPLFFSCSFCNISKISIHDIFIIAEYCSYLFYALKFCVKFHCKKALAKQFSSKMWIQIGGLGLTGTL